MKSFCLQHQDREAEFRCVSCLKPLCGECAQPDPEGSRFCSDGCSRSYQETGKRFAEMREREAALAAAARKAALFRQLTTLAILGALLLGLAVAWPSLPSAVKAPVVELYRQVVGR